MRDEVEISILLLNVSHHYGKALVFPKINRQGPWYLTMRSATRDHIPFLALSGLGLGKSGGGMEIK